MRLTLEQATSQAKERAKTYNYWYAVIQTRSDGAIMVMHKDDSDALLAMHPSWFRELYIASPAS